MVNDDSPKIHKGKGDKHLAPKMTRGGVQWASYMEQSVWKNG